MTVAPETAAIAAILGTLTAGGCVIAAAVAAFADYLERRAMRRALMLPRLPRD